MWRWNGSERPDFAAEVGPGQESVWDYPRPPRLVRDGRLVEVRVGDLLVASTRRAIRVLETASPPTFYLPADDVRLDLLTPAHGGSYCEWKGHAVYLDLVTSSGRIEHIAWLYPSPRSGFEDIQGCVAFYPDKADCWVNGERVRAQLGGFYGGWVTDEIVGPFKGEPGTERW